MFAHKMKRIVVVMPCYNRQDLCSNTINSILKYGYENCEIVVVDDASDIPFAYNNDRVHIIRIDKKDKKWFNSVIPYNYGLLYAINELNAEIIVTQNAEGYHYGNILQHINENLNPNEYFSYACLSVDESFGEVSVTKISQICDKIQNAASGNIELGWYNHSVLYPRAYDFCSAMYVEPMIKLNGFEERFYNHTWYGDDNFLIRVKKLGLKVSIIDEPFVVHQWHSRSHQPFGHTDASFQLLNKTIKEDSYSATHKFTKNLYE